MFGRNIDRVLAVIGFLVVVAAVVLPVVNGIADARRSLATVCTSNMKQLGLGLLQYEQDYDMKFPGGADHWAGQIYSYEKSTSVYICPVDRVAHKNRIDIVSYAMNANIRRKDALKLTEPTDTVLLTELDCGEPIDVIKPERVSQYTLGDTPNTAWGGIRLGTTADVVNPTRHGPSITFLACDGHVKLLRPEKVSSGIDALSLDGKQDATHAVGTKAIEFSTYELTFSEK